MKLLLPLLLLFLSGCCVTEKARLAAQQKILKIEALAQPSLKILNQNADAIHDHGAPHAGDLDIEEIMNYEYAKDDAWFSVEAFNKCHNTRQNMDRKVEEFQRVVSNIVQMAEDR